MRFRPSWDQPARSILLTARTRCGTRSEERMTACRRGLLGQPLAGVDEDEAEVGRRGTGHHVPCCTWPGVGDDELAPRGAK